MRKSEKPLLGFIGQGWIGKNYADNFEKRGFHVVRYSRSLYPENKERIKECDIVFIAVPTPTTPSGFDASIVESSIGFVGDNKVAVIKSTILPGTTKRFQKKYKKKTILFSPEFLSEATAVYDAKFPFSNIVGVPEYSARHRAAAKKVLSTVPKAPFSLICSSTEAEIIKYSHNASGYFQILLFNLMYDAALKLGCNWDVINKAIVADPLICNRYANPVHKSGRGAGGGCFIKDVAAFRELYQRLFPRDTKGLQVLLSLEKKNIDLLFKSGKDIGLLRGVYGKDLKGALSGKSKGK